MDTTSRAPLAADLSRTAVRPSLTLNTGMGGLRGLTSSGRPSPRARRDFLPTLNSPCPKDKAATSALRTSSSFRSTSSFKSRKEGRGLAVLIHKLKTSYFSGRRLLPWLVLMLVWGYIGFHMQTRWAVWQEMGDFQAGDQGLSALASSDYIRGSSSRLGLNKSEAGNARGNLRLKGWLKDWLSLRKGNGASPVTRDVEQESSREKSKQWGVISHAIGDTPEAEDKPRNSLKGNQHLDGKGQGTVKEGIVSESGDLTAGIYVDTNSKESDHHLGRTVGPFDETERQVLGSTRNSRRRACSRKGLFPDFVRGKNIVMVFHELSMTGAPLAVLELASEIVNCGGKVSAVVLNKKGGLYRELVQRGILILRDKLTYSWKAAARADLVVAGSAACNAWIGQYLQYNKKGGERLLWWLMENRREYFDRSKLLLGKAHALLFLSETQGRLWRQWASEASLTLPSIIEVINLSVNDGLAAVAGLDDETGSHGSAGKDAARKRENLRNQVRKEMGLEPSDFLVISLSSINPGKGQLMMLQAALMVAEGVEDEGLEGLARIDREGLNEAGVMAGIHLSSHERRNTGGGHRNLKILLGSVGSKSNKPAYLEKIYGLVDRHPSLANMLLWAEATVRVGPLYAAADAYVINAQGIGETFGRVTVEAMAFGLPVLGTDAGGTKEIIEANITGLLHPAGEMGIPVLARHLRWLLQHPETGVEMGEKGRDRVRRMFREAPMYEAMGRMFIDCVRERGG